MGNEARQKATSKKRRAFLAAYAVTGNISTACDAAQVDRGTHYKWLENEDYKVQFYDAQMKSAESLEAEARRRAQAGVHRLKFHQGNPIMVPCPSGDWECAIGHRGPRGERSEVGWECPLCETPQQPVMVPYVEHEYSDTLLIFLLKGVLPEKYRERAEIKHEFSDLKDEQLIAEAKELLAGIETPGTGARNR